MNRLAAILLILFPLAMEAQQKQLRGKVITDELKAENLTVTNTITNTTTVTDSDGNFTIPASTDDTLTFTGDIFKPLTVVLKAADFAEELLVVRVEPIATMLNEVVVTGLTGNLAADSKKIKTLQVDTWFDAAEINKDVLTHSDIGANWIGGFTMLFRKPKKPKRATAYVMADIPEQKLFSEVVRQSYPDSFFIEALIIPARFIGAYLAFCDEDAKRHLLMLQNEPALVEYLKNKSAEFLKLNPDAR